MRNLFLFLPFIICFVQVAEAQKFGYIDTDYILAQMPEYKEAEAEIAQLSKSWQSEIQQMYREIESMYNELQAEEVLLTQEMKDERLAEIQTKEEEVKEYNSKVFGYEGLFFLKKKELMKPVLESVFDATEKVSKAHRLQFMFDKAADMVMIYTDPIHDYTDYVLEELGYGDENDTIK
jgi:outer membrane protein